MKYKSSKKALAIIGCITVQICVGILYVWSVFREPVIEKYGWDAGAVNLIASFMLFCFCAGNLAGGLLQDRFGPKRVCFAGIIMFGLGIFFSSLVPEGAPIIWFYLSYCLLAGLGSGICYGPVLACMQKWFPDRRGFASGLAAGAFGLSSVIFAPVANALTRSFGVSRALLILSIIFLVAGLAACFLISVPSETGDAAKVTDEISYSPLKAARTLPFWLLFAGCFFYNGTWNMLSPIIKTLGAGRGMSDALATLCVSFTGIANAAGRLIMASISDKTGRIFTYILLCYITIASGILLIFSGNGFLFGVILMTAFAYGGPAAISPAATTDFFGPRFSGSNYGIIMLGLGLSSVVFNVISNALYKASGSYTMTFITGAASTALSMVIYIIIGILNRRKSAAN